MVAAPLLEATMDEQRYQRALRRVREQRDFYIHLVVYAIVVGGLFGIDWITRPPGLTWVYFPAIAWGTGLAIHAFMVFGADRFLGTEWEERKARELLERESRQPR
jgi:hypothetical protein